MKDEKIKKLVEEIIDKNIKDNVNTKIDEVLEKTIKDKIVESSDKVIEQTESLKKLLKGKKSFGQKQ